MEWDNFRQSDNVEDRRGDDGGGGDGGGGGMIGGGGLGIGAIVVILIVSYFLGIDPRVLINGAEQVNNTRHGYQGQQSASTDEPAARGPDEARDGSEGAVPKDTMGKFVAAVLGETEDTWSRVLPAQKGIQYEPVKLVLYSGQTRSACGGARAQMGPFYCPIDKKVYLDLSFFREMKRKLGGGGDFAYAYVIAHEIGHHIQDQLGILGKAQAAEQRSGATQRNAISVKIELMADCLAGVWANNSNQKDHFLQAGDVDKAVNTARAIGDDTLEQAAQGQVVPDSFTHGTSAQRARWLQTGLRSGQIDACNTFADE